MNCICGAASPLWHLHDLKMNGAKIKMVNPKISAKQKLVSLGYSALTRHNLPGSQLKALWKYAVVKATYWNKTKPYQNCRPAPTQVSP